MESLAETYRDVSLLRLKYEHLCGVCRQLLKRWPKNNPPGELSKTAIGQVFSAAGHGSEPRIKSVQEDDQTCQYSNTPTPDDPIPETPPPVTETPPTSDLQLLEEILSKAHRIRASQSVADGGATTGPRSTRSTRTVQKGGQDGKGVQNVKGAQNEIRGRGVGRKSAAMAADVYGRSHSSNKPSMKARDKQLSAGAPKSAKGSQKSLRGRGSQSMVDSYKQQSKVYLRERKPRTSSKKAPWRDPIGPRDVVEVGHMLQQNSDLSSSEQSSMAALQSGVKQLSLEGGVRDQTGASGLEEAVGDGAGQRRMEGGGGERATGFDIRRNGTRLSMPAKYHRLHEALSKVTDYWQSIPSNPEAQAAADSFCSRLTAKEPPDSARTIQLLLAKQEYEALKEQLLALTPKELTVAERSRWQDVLQIKTKLDFIEQGIQSLRTQLTTTELPGVSQANSHDTHPQDVSTLPQPLPHTYASLGDWQAQSLCELQLKLQSCELAVLQFCTEVVLPRVFQLQSTDSRHFPALIQSLYELAGLHQKPIYLAAEN